MKQTGKEGIRRRSLVGVIAAMAVVNLVYGITFPLLALVLDSQHVSKSLIGLSTIVQAGAILAIAPFAPGLMTRFAPARLMQAMSVLLALLFIIAGLYQNVWFWFPLRLIIGAATALLWIASEALINELAVERWRGRIIAVRWGRRFRTGTIVVDYHRIRRHGSVRGNQFDDIAGWIAAVLR